MLVPKTWVGRNEGEVVGLVIEIYRVRFEVLLVLVL